ncbi:DNA replication ATP-dependent helicase/nuclease DNA2 [Phytophthora nicotianae]|uniref:DNA replication ATP-dependent helicase/nuclease DNA2 n=1 Tax=Phytophthora nicotianae TaxID=4792 RepID=A0A0W8CW63_PHYNI|nr:DNA replication ATP-dependent helicase/nuclease DNA2 [Phytophthora nicotianae]
MRLHVSSSSETNDKKLEAKPDDHADDDYVAEHQRAQQIERQKQDESLDELHSAVKRLGDMSLNISTELDTQNK